MPKLLTSTSHTTLALGAGLVKPSGRSIPAFCAAYGFSRAHYYNLRKLGLTPDELRLMGRVVITDEAETKWRRQHTTAPPAATATTTTVTDST